MGVERAVRLRGVLDHRYPEVGKHRRPPVEVHGNDRARAFGHRGLGAAGIERRGVGVDVDEDGRGPRRAHRGGGRHRGERRDDHLVAVADAQRGEREAERVGPRRHSHRVSPAGERGELGLERVELGTEQVEPDRTTRATASESSGSSDCAAAAEIDDGNAACAG